MNETYEQEIDLKWLIYRVLRAWRGIVALALITACVIALAGCGLKLIRISDSEYLAEQKTIFDREYAAWEAKGDNLAAELANLQTSRDNQLEYNSNSVLMKINPLREYNASFQLYIDYEYQIDPSLSYQNIDLSDRIVKAYATYITNGEMYRYIIEKLSYEMELRYFKEIVDASADYSNNMISISIRHENEEKGQEILRLAAEGLREKYADINEMIAEHKLVEMNAASYEAVNLSLDTHQKDNVQNISDLDILIQQKTEQYQAWKNQPEPEREYTIAEVIKSTIKTLIVAGVVCGVLFAVVVAFLALLSAKLLNPEDIKKRFGIRLLGELPAQRGKKKPFAFVSRWFAAFGGITMVPEDYERLAKVAGTGLAAELSVREESDRKKSVAFTGTVAEEEMQKLLAVMQPDNGDTFRVVPDILVNAESIGQIMEADYVVLVEKQEESKLADIQKELEALKAWNKTVLGAIVLNTDAVM